MLVGSSVNWTAAASSFDVWLPAELELRQESWHFAEYRKCVLSVATFLLNALSFSPEHQVYLL